MGIEVGLQYDARTCSGEMEKDTNIVYSYSLAIGRDAWEPGLSVGVPKAPRRADSRTRKQSTPFSPGRDRWLPNSIVLRLVDAKHSRLVHEGHFRHQHHKCDACVYHHILIIQSDVICYIAVDDVHGDVEYYARNNR